MSKGPLVTRAVTRQKKGRIGGDRPQYGHLLFDYLSSSMEAYGRAGTAQLQSLNLTWDFF